MEKEYGDFEMVNGAVVNGLNEEVAELKATNADMAGRLAAVRELLGLRDAEGLGRLPGRIVVQRNFDIQILAELVNSPSFPCPSCATLEARLERVREAVANYLSTGSMGFWKTTWGTKHITRTRILVFKETIDAILKGEPMKPNEHEPFKESPEIGLLRQKVADLTTLLVLSREDQTILRKKIKRLQRAVDSITEIYAVWDMDSNRNSASVVERIGRILQKAQ